MRVAVRKLFGRQGVVADIELVGGVLEVNSVTGSWVRSLLEEMRDEGMTDTELWDSLPERLNGHLWLAEVDG